MFNYNKIYKNYQFAWGNNANFVVKKALRLFKAKAKLKVLDLGCGQGKDTFFWQKRVLKLPL